MPAPPQRSRSTLLVILALWAVFYCSFTLVRPALLDDADSVHAEVAREMLLRRDPITLYANGIRYLEKAPVLYWSMAASMRLSQLLGHPGPRALATAARIPLALTVLALALVTEAFARRAFRNPRAGLYAALILLSSPGIFLFTRILLPDALVCLWLTLALYAFLLTEPDTLPAQTVSLRPKSVSPQTASLQPERSAAEKPGVPGELARWGGKPTPTPAHVPGTAGVAPCLVFAAACALNVLTKGLIGIVFPIFIVALYLLLTRGVRGAFRRIAQLHPVSSSAVFLAIAAPWHILIALANPAQGHPGALTFTNHHWLVPLPTDGNVHGWLWFYFVNEQLLRYLNLRVPRDYDTVPLYLFWGLCFIWLMPWSGFALKAAAAALRPLFFAMRLLRNGQPGFLESRRTLRSFNFETRTRLLLSLWAAFVLLFFLFSTRQEYYVLPALPALAILIGGWLASDSGVAPQPHTATAKLVRRANLRITAVLLALGGLFALAALTVLLRTHAPAPNTDLASLLQQNPGDYAMSMGHFLDLNAQALGFFRLPLTLAAASLVLGPLAAFVLHRKNRPHPANLALAAGAFGFLIAAHLGLQTFAPVLTSAQLAEAIAPYLHPIHNETLSFPSEAPSAAAQKPASPPAAEPLIVIHQEYEFASTLGFYLQLPTYTQGPHPTPQNPIHILTDPTHNNTPNYGRSSNLWYGSFFPDAPRIFETHQSLAALWPGPRRIFLWQDLGNQPSPPPALPGPVFVIARSGGKELLSNQPNP